MSQQTCVLTIEGISPTEASRYAKELRNALLNASEEIEVEYRRDDPRAQDFGATLILVLGTPAVVAAVSALRDWLKVRNTASVTVKTPSGEIIFQNLSSKGAEKLGEYLLGKQ